MALGFCLLPSGLGSFCRAAVSIRDPEPQPTPLVNGPTQPATPPDADSRQTWSSRSHHSAIPLCWRTQNSHLSHSSLKQTLPPQDRQQSSRGPALGSLPLQGQNGWQCRAQDSPVPAHRHQRQTSAACPGSRERRPGRGSCPEGPARLLRSLRTSGRCRGPGKQLLQMLEPQ